MAAIEAAGVDRRGPAMVRRLRWGALMLALLIAVSLPTARLYFGAQTRLATLATEAEELADRLSQRASSEPDTWHYERNALLAMFEATARRGTADALRLIDEAGRELAAHGRWTRRLVLEHRAEVLDSGVRVATIRAQSSLAPLLGSVAPIAVFSALLGLATWSMIGSALRSLARTLAELREARRVAEQASQARTAFLATMSHEIRTPMNGVLGMTSLLAETELDATQRHYVDVVRSSGDALLTVINDILEFTKASSGRVELEPQVFQPEELAQDVLSLLGPLAAEKRLDLLCRVEHGTAEWLLADATRIRQVLLNVVGNAIKFTAAGDVMVSIDEPAPGRLRYTVRDSGIGMTSEQAARIFDPFTQADASTTRRFGGTGLGLAISRHLAEAMGGGIRVESEPGRGSTFFIDVAVEAAAEPADSPQRADAAALAGRRVLVVDDNGTHLEIMATMLRAWQVEVRTVDSGERALRIVRDSPAFDAALIDYDMPVMDGATLAHRLRRVAPGVPLVLVSASNGADGVTARFDARLHKPIRRKLLLDMLLRLTAGDASARDTSTARSDERAAAPAPAKPAAADPATDVASRPAAGLRVLVVEDNPVNALLARTMLERCGCASDQAGNGLEALAALDRQAYDLILMDMLMPEMDGLEATRAIRARALHPQPYVIGVTANAMEDDRAACLAAGMDAFLPKPVRLADLRRTLAEIREGLAAA